MFYFHTTEFEEYTFEWRIIHFLMVGISTY